MHNLVLLAFQVTFSWRTGIAAHQTHIYTHMYAEQAPLSNKIKITINKF